MTRELNEGGSERQVAEIARALDPTRFEAHVGCFHDAGWRADELRKAGIPVQRFPITSYLGPSAISGGWQLIRYIRRNRIRIVHTFDYPLTAYAVPVARMFTSAAVLASQRAHRSLIPPLYVKLLRLSDRMANAVVVNCEFVRQHLIREEHVPRERIRLCYNGLDLSTFRTLGIPKPKELADARLVIGVVCVLRPEKGLPTLVEAFAQVQREFPDLKLVIVGSGPELPSLQEQARRLGVSERCLFTPSTGQVTEWLNAIDIFVLPSLSEALSNSLMEAMACGCCGVASSAGGNPELVEHDRTGLLFPPGDTAALAGALRRLIENESVRMELAANGQRFIRDNFSIQNSAACMADIYSEFLLG